MKVDGTISSNCYKVGVKLFQDSRVTNNRFIKYLNNFRLRTG